MVIMQKTCFCGKLIKENGKSALESSVTRHFQEEHPDKYKAVEKLRSDATKELRKLEEKYQDKLFLNLAMFDINIDELLKG